MPRFVLPSGRRPAGDVFLPWLLVLVVLLPWCCTAAGFARGGGATLRGVPRFKNSHGRRPSIHGEGEPPKVGEPRRGAPVADRFAAFRFAQAVCFPQFWPFQLLENYF